MRVLIVEDDAALRALLVEGLEENGFVVDAVDTGEDAIQSLRLLEYDLTVVDWMLPDLTGLDVVRWVRRRDRPTGVLMLTARDLPRDRIRGLDAGADDYLVKPFDFGELLARLRALQRRPRGVQSPTLVRGLLALDPVRREVAVGGCALHLTRTEYQILELLMRRAPAVVSRTLIAEQAWRDETDPIGSNAIDVQISRLRAKLAHSGVRVVTVRGAGYRLEES